MNKKLMLIALGALTLTFVTCKKESGNDAEETGTTGTTSGTGTSAKDQARKDYQEMYVASGVANFTWNGNTGSCNAGTLSQDVLDKALLRIKYFRKVAGVPNDKITMEADLSAKCQDNALMIKANNALSHNPPSTWSCFTAGGAEAAQNGNIAFGGSDVQNISQWVEDEGSNNTEVGHRRWILFSNATKFGFGCTQNSGTLWVINSINDFSLPAGTPEFIAWPAKGYVPRQVVYPRWSFSVPMGSHPFQVDFTNATVTMKNAAGETVNLQIESRTAISNSYAGDNSIVWKPTGINLGSTDDQKYTVSISGVKVNGATKSYEYDVTIFNP
jgi:uncharacterized protein YkwD